MMTKKRAERLKSICFKKTDKKGRGQIEIDHIFCEECIFAINEFVGLLITRGYSVDDLWFSLFDMNVTFSLPLSDIELEKVFLELIEYLYKRIIIPQKMEPGEIRIKAESDAGDIGYYSARLEEDSFIMTYQNVVQDVWGYKIVKRFVVQNGKLIFKEEYIDEEDDKAGKTTDESDREFEEWRRNGFGLRGD